ncbi:MAG: DUF4124 domain-containing protein [Gammaproteobacteria bacterium]|nr:DUF4124 domain-containing protein [Gammaproteobacteria bacterium]
MKILPFFTTLLLSVSATAGVYTWTDSSGRVHYSDKPPATAAEKLDIDLKRTDPEQLSARLSDVANEQVQPETIIADQAEQERLEREQKIRRDENCARARKAQNSLLSATRVYEPLPGGDRRYLEQDEVDQKKADAQRDVDKWCDNSQ